MEIVSKNTLTRIIKCAIGVGISSLETPQEITRLIKLYFLLPWQRPKSLDSRFMWDHKSEAAFILLLILFSSWQKVEANLVSEQKERDVAMC